MTASPSFPAASPNGIEATSHILSGFPVGGADPDFVALETTKPAICAVPMLGKMLSQCKLSWVPCPVS